MELKNDLTMMTKRICFFIDSLFNSGGMERISIDLANELVDYGFDVDFVVCSDNTDSFFELNEHIEIISIHTDSRTGSKLAGAKIIRQLWKERHYDMWINVGIHLIKMVFLSGIRRKGCKIITWEHFSSNRNYTRIKWWMMAMMSDAVVVLTEADKAVYHPMLRDKVHVIANFSVANLQEKSSTCAESIVISVGRLEYTKGFDLLINAWAIVARTHPTWKLKIFGEGEERGSLEKQIHDFNLKSVELPGRNEHIIDELTQASIYAMSSRYESFGIGIIEAMSAGLPVVCFNCAYGPPEIVVDGVTGLQTPCYNIEKYAENLSKLISDIELRKSYGNNGLKRFNELYTKEKVIGTWLELISRVLR